jgi:hypothetical protein
VITSDYGLIVVCSIPIASVGINHAYRPIRRGRHLGMAHTQEHSSWQTIVQAKLREPGSVVWHTDERVWDKEKSYFAPVLHMWLPSRRNDIDGRIKGLQDEVCKYFGIVDSRFDALGAFRHIDKNNPRAEVEIWGLHGYLAAVSPLLAHRQG